MYANYAHFIERAEVRIFEPAQSLEAEPVGVVVFGPDGSGEWLPEPALFATPARELKYVLRAYGSGGTFDETVPQPLWIAYRDGEPTAASRRAAESAEALFAELTTAGAPYAASCAAEPRRLPQRSTCARGGSITSDGALRVAYGENNLGLSNIPLASGSVTVRGSAVPAGHRSRSRAGPCRSTRAATSSRKKSCRRACTRSKSRCSTTQGNGNLYLRDLELERNDWFYVGMADLTLTSERHQRADRAAARRELDRTTSIRRPTRGSRSSSTASSTKAGI